MANDPPKGEMHKRIIQCCKERDIVPSNMCDDLGLSRNILTALRDRGSMATKTLAVIAAYLHVSCDWLITGREFNDQISHFDRTLVDAFHAAPSDTQQNICFMLRNYGIADVISEDAPSLSSKTG